MTSIWLISTLLVSMLLPISSSHSAEPISALKEACNGAERSIEACTSLIDLSERSPKSLSVAFADRGLAFYRWWRLSSAVKDFDQAVQLNPKNIQALNNRGLSYSAKGQLDRAIEDFDAALGIDPDLYDALVNKSFVLVCKKQADAAIRVLDRVTAADPSVYKSFNVRGLAYTKAPGR